MTLTPVILSFSRRIPSIGEIRSCGNGLPPRCCAWTVEAPAAPTAELKNDLLDEVIRYLLIPGWRRQAQGSTLPPFAAGSYHRLYSRRCPWLPDAVFFWAQSPRHRRRAVSA